MQIIRLSILTHQANFKLHIYYIPDILLGWGQKINETVTLTSETDNVEGTEKQTRQ